MIQELAAQLWRQVSQRRRLGDDSGHEAMRPESQHYEPNTLDTPTDTGAGRQKTVGFQDVDGHYPTEARLRQKQKEKEAKYRAAADGSVATNNKKAKNMGNYEKVWTDCGDDMSSIDLEVSELWMDHVTVDPQQCNWQVDGVHHEMGWSAALCFADESGMQYGSGDDGDISMKITHNKHDAVYLMLNSLGGLLQY
eukprot:1713666-Pyramimonas_sp.AAC.2